MSRVLWSQLSALSQPTVEAVVEVPGAVQNLFVSSNGQDLVVDWDVPITGGDPTEYQVDLYAPATGNVVPEMTSNTSPSGVASASSEWSVDFEAWKGFNHATGASVDRLHWQSQSGGVEPPSWLKYDFGQVTDITDYTVEAAYTDDAAAPSAWTLEGSNNDIDWTTLDTQSGVTNWGSGVERKQYSLGGTESYRYYRLSITAIAGAQDRVRVGEFELLGNTVVLIDTQIISSPATTFTWVGQAYGTYDVTVTAQNGVGQAAAVTLNSYVHTV